MSFTNSDIELYERLWKKFHGGQLNIQALIDGVLKDGGHDMTGLTQHEIAALIEGRFTGDWNKVAFSFSELLSYYDALGQKLTDTQAISWVFSAFTIAEAIKHGVTDWELQFNSVINGFSRIKGKFGRDELLEIFQRIFSPVPPVWTA